jgi:hypothetical protein
LINVCENLSDTSYIEENITGETVFATIQIAAFRNYSWKQIQR